MRKHPVAAPATATCRPTYLSCATGEEDGEEGGIGENKASATLVVSGQVKLGDISLFLCLLACSTGGGEDGEGEDGEEGGISGNKASAITCRFRTRDRLKQFQATSIFVKKA